MIFYLCFLIDSVTIAVFLSLSMKNMNTGIQEADVGILDVKNEIGSLKS